MEQHLGVAGGLKDRPLADERIAQLLGVHEVAVVPDRDLAVGAVDENRLRVFHAAFARCRIAHVANRAPAPQARDGLFRKAVGDVADSLVDIEPFAIGRGDPDALLSAVLERVETEVRQVRGLTVPVDAEDTAFLAKLVHCLFATLAYWAALPHAARLKRPGPPATWPAHLPTGLPRQ